MFKRFFLVIISALLLGANAANAASTKRLEEDEKSHYAAVKVFMGEKERKKWLKLKTRDLRDAWLKERKLWERYYQYDDEMRQQIAAGEVAVGWPQDAVLMSWGMPHQRKRLTGRPAIRSEMFVYRFEVDYEGYVTVWQPKSKTAHLAVKLYQVDLVMDDAVVGELRQKDKWD